MGHRHTVTVPFQQLFISYDALRDGANQEVYQWQLNTESKPLKPGEAKSFVTRIASPPQAAEAVEIRFARADEIGSNTMP